MNDSHKKIFSNIENILRGRTGRNLEIGILTAENEMGNQLSDSENNKRNDLLQHKLSSKSIRVYPLQGNFGGLDENSFLVVGIPLSELKELAHEFKQQAFIYGNGRDDDMIFHYMEISDDNDESDYESVQIRRTFIYKPNAEDNFSMYKGVKFVVPFFDNDYTDVRWNELSSEERGEIPDNSEEPREEESDKDNHESVTTIARIRNLIESLKIDESKVKIKVKHSDLLEIPEGKKFYNVPFKHYVELVEKKGYAKVIRALNNISVWHKEEHPEIGNKAEAIMDKLKSKFGKE